MVLATRMLWDKCLCSMLSTWENPRQQIALTVTRWAQKPVIISSGPITTQKKKTLNPDYNPSYRYLLLFSAIYRGLYFHLELAGAHLVCFLCAWRVIVPKDPIAQRN